MIVNIADAKTNLSKLIKMVQQGEKVVIAKNNKPIADLVIHKPEFKRKLGVAPGTCIIPDDFDVKDDDDDVIEDIIDTTGSGDAFIGGIIYGLLFQELWSKDKLLRFASYIAMCKLKGIGARSSLPFLAEINMNLFS